MSGWICKSAIGALVMIGATVAFADDQVQTDIGKVTTGAGGEAEQTVVKPSAVRDRAAAIEEKKEAPNIIEVQPLGEMLKLPDVNLAEALQRMPGISVETDTGEGRFVNIRGLDSDLNGTTYGGVRLPPSNPSSPFGGGRATAFDVIPTGLVGGIELTKTNRPDIDAEALGGTINLVPRSGDSEGGKPFTEVTVGGGYENLRDTPVYDFGLTTGRSFSRDGDGLFTGPNAFSALLTAIYHQDRRGIDDVEESYSDQQSAGVPDKLLSDLDYRRYLYQRETYGFAGNFDAKADERNSFYARFMWSGYLEFKTDHHLTLSGLDSGCGPATLANGNLDCTAAAPSSVYPNGFTAPGASLDQNNTDSSERIDNQLAVIGGKSIIGGTELDYHMSLAQGRDIVYYKYGPDFSELNNGNIPIAYDNTSNPNYPNYRTLDGTDATNPANYALSDLSAGSATDRDREWGGGLDLKIPVTVWGNPGEVKFGLNARMRHKTHQEIDEDFAPAGSNQILLSNYVSGPDTIYYNGLYNIGPPFNEIAIRGLPNSPLVQNVSVADGDPMSAQQAYEDDNENVYAEYGMLTATAGNFGLLVGLRVEETNATYRAFGFSTDINGNTTNLGVDRPADFLHQLLSDRTGPLQLHRRTGRPGNLFDGHRASGVRRNHCLDNHRRRRYRRQRHDRQPEFEADNRQQLRFVARVLPGGRRHCECRIIRQGFQQLHPADRHQRIQLSGRGRYCAGQHVLERPRACVRHGSCLRRPISISAAPVGRIRRVSQCNPSRFAGRDSSGRLRAAAVHIETHLECGGFLRKRSARGAPRVRLRGPELVRLRIHGQHEHGSIFARKVDAGFWREL